MMFTKLLSDINQWGHFGFFSASYFKLFVVFGFGFVVIIDVG